MVPTIAALATSHQAATERVPISIRKEVLPETRCAFYLSEAGQRNKAGGGDRITGPPIERSTFGG